MASQRSKKSVRYYSRSISSTNNLPWGNYLYSSSNSVALSSTATSVSTTSSDVSPSAYYVSASPSSPSESTTTVSVLSSALSYSKKSVKQFWR